MSEPTEKKAATANNGKHPLIIEEPDSLRLPHKITAVGLTLLFWGILIYLWQPLISMVAWALNIKLFYNHMIVLGGYHNFLALVVDYLIVIGIMGGVLIIWARINLWRFRGKERRKRPADATTEELAQYFEVSAQEMEQWRQMDSLEIGLNEKELPSAVAVHMPFKDKPADEPEASSGGDSDSNTDTDSNSQTTGSQPPEK